METTATTRLTPVSVRSFHPPDEERFVVVWRRKPAMFVDQNTTTELLLVELINKTGLSGEVRANWMALAAKVFGASLG